MIAILAGGMIFAMSIIYFLIALGCPYGRLIFGGKYRVEPIWCRLLCVAALVVQFFEIVVVLQTYALIPLWFAWPITKALCFVFAGWLAVHAMLHILSKSPSERAVMAPLCCAASVCYWATALTV